MSKAAEEGTEVAKIRQVPEQDKEMGFFDHLTELRTRLLRCLVAILIFSIMSYFVSQEAFVILSEPFSEGFSTGVLIGTGPAEAFILRLKISVFLGFLLALPIVSYQIWRFIEPGLYAEEKKAVVPFVFFTSTLFLVGTLFCYIVVLPFAYTFFEEQYKALGISPTIRMSEHLALILKAFLGFGLVFEIPVVSYFLARLGVIRAQDLIEYFRYAVVIIFVLAAVLTPPDVLTQLLMAGPMLLLYGVGILVARMAEKKRNESEVA